MKGFGMYEVISNFFQAPKCLNSSQIYIKIHKGGGATCVSLLVHYIWILRTYPKLVAPYGFVKKIEDFSPKQELHVDIYNKLPQKI